MLFQEQIEEEGTKRGKNIGFIVLQNRNEENKVEIGAKSKNEHMKKFLLESH